MLRFANRPYVCWRCLAHSRSGVGATKSAGADPVDQRRRIQTTQLKSATPRHKSPLPAPYGRPNTPNLAQPSGQSPRKPSTGDDENRVLPIRERLRLWTPDKDKLGEFVRESPFDARLDGSISNMLSRTQSTGSSIYDQLRTGEDNSDSLGGELDTQDAEVSSVGSDSRIPGDLVEIRSHDSRAPILAVYLGYFSSRNHFYGSNGRWLTSLGFSPLFSVSNFASTTELEPLLAKIPANATPDQLQNLRDDNGGPSREDGAGLIRKMTAFRDETENIYQSNLGKLDGMQELLASSRQLKYLSLFEIAEMLLPESLKNDHGFLPTALYAIHRAIFNTELGFSPLSPSRDCHRRDHLYEVLPRNYMRIAENIATMVRAYTTSNSRRLRAPGTPELKGTVMGLFILQAREIVLASRSQRDWTPHGILWAPTGASFKQVEWTKAGREIITFMELWASHDLFGAGSRFHSYGAIILRALGLYKDAALDQNTAWTFLQEIGIVSSWEISSRYKVRFPHTTFVKGSGLERETPGDIAKSKRSDIAAECRKAWTGASVFCIDAPTTTVIDDGVSLERTDRADEFWVHIHTADPASVISPNSELCKYMELVPENIYLPGHFQAMLPSNFGEDESGDYKSEGLVGQFSLRSGAPALTFSAKVNNAGEILDYKIQPGTINNVKYLDPEDVSAFCNEPPPPPISEKSLTVGTPPEKEAAPPNRSMVAARHLDESSKDDLRVLYRLAEAIKQTRLSKGAWPYFFPRSSVSVSFPDAPAGQAAQDASTIISPDPYIKVSKESSTGCSVVSNTMVLAGEIAARWCSSRGIPIPFRRDVKSAENFPAALAYATGELYPLIKQGVEPSASLRQELSALTGGIEISSEPGPYFLLGLDMYAKATSPLRRFSDLLVHWQIHAALSHERETGRSLDPATDDLDTILPFSREGLENTISLLHMREKMARSVSRGSEQWILQALVRAWKFEKTTPRSMRFTVDSRWNMGVMGRLDLFDLHAIIEVGGLNGRVLLKDIKVGDEFEVELDDINVHSKQVVVKAIRYFGQGDTVVPQLQRREELSVPGVEYQGSEHRGMDPALA